MSVRPTVALLAAVAAAIFLAPAAHAQGRGAGRGFAPGLGARGGRFGIGRGARGRYSYGWGYLPLPYDYGDGIVYWPPPEPQYQQAPVVEQPPQPAPKPAAEPLLMEERDGQWVRVPNGTELPTASQSAAAASSFASAAPKLPSAVIVFRDGHQEQVDRYMIQGEVIQTSTDYYSTGSWTRTIHLADLDVPATLKANQERGAKFNLPSNPTEVMIRF